MTPSSSPHPLSVIASLLLARYASGDLPAPLRRHVRDRLAADPALARRYTMLRKAERTAGRAVGRTDRADPPPLSASARDLLERALLEDVVASLAHNDGTAMHPVLSTAGAAWRGVVGPLAGVAAALAALVVTATPAPDAAFGFGDLAARAALLGQDPLGVKVSCVVNDAVIDRATAGARSSGDVLRCARGGLLAFSTTNLGAAPRHAFVLGVARDGARRWYAPFDRDALSVVVPPGQVDAIVPTLADTTTLPDDDVALFVLLSDVPFSGRDVERMLQAAERRGAALGRLDRLPVPVPVQGRIELTSTSATLVPGSSPPSRPLQHAR